MSSSAAFNFDIPDRYELKYVIPEWRVPQVRDAILPFCQLDPYAAASADHQYVIQSLYLDTPSRDLYRVSRERRPERFKARIRIYGECEGSSPVFLEVKRKVRGLIRKTRTRLQAGSWKTHLDGPLLPDTSTAERAFRNELARLALEPVLLVRYEREAWFSAVDRYARVTFDRRLVCQPWERWDFESCPRSWLPLDNRSTLKAVPQAIVLELKCMLDVPRWMSNLTECLGLKRAGVSKYCNGIERIWGRQALPHFLSYSA